MVQFEKKIAAAISFAHRVNVCDERLRPHLQIAEYLRYDISFFLWSLGLPPATRLDFLSGLSSAARGTLRKEWCARRRSLGARKRQKQ
jgi:hypothetical protein